MERFSGVDGALVRRLLASQFPELARPSAAARRAWGTDHTIFRLGERLSVRLPKIHWAAEQGTN